MAVTVIAIAKRKSYLASPNLCAKCGTSILPKRGEKLAFVTKRKFCSRNCSLHFVRGLRKRRSINLSKCVVCGTNCNTWGRRFCSKTCETKHKCDHYISQWKCGKRSGMKKGNVLSPAVRRYMLAKAGNKCEKCGWGEVNTVTGKSPLNVDHIDGDSGNSREENLRVLCPNCHSLTPTYGVLNRGRGRSLRREKYRLATVA